MRCDAVFWRDRGAGTMMRAESAWMAPPWLIAVTLQLSCWPRSAVVTVYVGAVSLRMGALPRTHRYS